MFETSSVHANNSLDVGIDLVKNAERQGAAATQAVSHAAAAITIRVVLLRLSGCRSTVIA